MIACNKTAMNFTVVGYGDLVEKTNANYFRRDIVLLKVKTEIFVNYFPCRLTISIWFRKNWGFIEVTFYSSTSPPY